MDPFVMGFTAVAAIGAAYAIHGTLAAPLAYEDEHGFHDWQPSDLDRRVDAVRHDGGFGA